MGLQDRDYYREHHRQKSVRTLKWRQRIPRSFVGMAVVWLCVGCVLFLIFKAFGYR